MKPVYFALFGLLFAAACSGTDFAAQFQDTTTGPEASPATGLIVGKGEGPD
ncbi:MAG: hypothetical protein AAFQ51_02275 [Pseudomonadota bacterium]